MVISDLRAAPHFLGIMADRIWNAFWQESGRPLSYIHERAGDSLGSQGIPFALIAYEAERFLGTVSVISSDMEERPELTPWIAALWVEPDARKRGLGTALLENATKAAFELGMARLYLSTGPLRRPFYLKLGWAAHEEDVGAAGMTILRKDHSASDVDGRSQSSRPRQQP